HTRFSRDWSSDVCSSDLIRTYRYRGHSMSDAEPYRTKEEVEQYKKEDPILLMKDIILKKKYATEEELDKIVEQVKVEVDECVDFAEKSPFPSKETMYKYTYSQQDYPYLDQFENN